MSFMRCDFLSYLKLLIYFFGMIFTKFKIINNLILKKLGVRLFLKNRNIEELNLIGVKYAKKIKFNNIFKNEFGKYESPIIVSASFKEYLKYIFPKNHLIGSELKYENNIVKGVAVNCYSGLKLEMLNQFGIKKIDILYTDSLSDAPLAKIANEIVLVKGDKMVRCNSIKEFFLELS